MQDEKAHLLQAGYRFVQTIDTGLFVGSTAWRASVDLLLQIAVEKCDLHVDLQIVFVSIRKAQLA